MHGGGEQRGQGRIAVGVVGAARHGLRDADRGAVEEPRPGLAVDRVSAQDLVGGLRREDTLVGAHVVEPVATEHQDDGQQQDARVDPGEGAAGASGEGEDARDQDPGVADGDDPGDGRMGGHRLRPGAAGADEQADRGDQGHPPVQLLRRGRVGCERPGPRRTGRGGRVVRPQPQTTAGTGTVFHGVLLLVPPGDRQFMPGSPPLHVVEVKGSGEVHRREGRAGQENGGSGRSGAWTCHGRRRRAVSTAARTRARRTPRRRSPPGCPRSGSS